MQNYNYSNNYIGENEYYYQLQQAKKRERKALGRNASKLGILLLSYNLLTNLFVIVYYYLVYAYYNHSISLNYNVVLGYLRGQPELINSSLFSMLGNLFAVFFGLMVTMLIAMIPMNIDFTELLSPRKGQVKQAVKWFPLCMTINISMSVMVSILSEALKSTGITVPDADFSITKPDTLTIVVQVLYIIFVGPGAEEIIYRGIILTLLKPFGKWLAVVVSALVFGLMHGNIPQAVPAIAGALVYGLVAIHCNSIIPSILIHIANNALASYMDFADVFGWPEQIYHICLIITTLAGIYILFTRLYQLRIGKEASGVLSTERKYLTVFTNGFMIIYLLLIIWNFISLFLMAN